MERREPFEDLSMFTIGAISVFAAEANCKQPKEDTVAGTTIAEEDLHCISEFEVEPDLSIVLIIKI